MRWAGPPQSTQIMEGEGEVMPVVLLVCELLQVIFAGAV